MKIIYTNSQYSYLHSGKKKMGQKMAIHLIIWQKSYDYLRYNVK